MSLKDRFANHSDTPAEQPQPVEQKSVELYDTAGHARNICFVQKNGEREFLSYAYLTSGKFSPIDNSINLSFTTHEVEIKGKNLEGLFGKIGSQEVQIISVIEERYLQLNSEQQTFISEIAITKS